MELDDVKFEFKPINPDNVRNFCLPVYIETKGLLLRNKYLNTNSLSSVQEKNLIELYKEDYKRLNVKYIENTALDIFDKYMKYNCDTIAHDCDCTSFSFNDLSIINNLWNVDISELTSDEFALMMDKKKLKVLEIEKLTSENISEINKIYNEKRKNEIDNELCLNYAINNFQNRYKNINNFTNLNYRQIIKLFSDKLTDASNTINDIDMEYLKAFEFYFSPLEKSGEECFKRSYENNYYLSRYVKLIRENGYNINYSRIKNYHKLKLDQNQSKIFDGVYVDLDKNILISEADYYYEFDHKVYVPELHEFEKFLKICSFQDSLEIECGKYFNDLARKNKNIKINDNLKNDEDVKIRVYTSR